mmetsp:Transcript_922/g.2806  ORF Transcript_922/g.2806 Transcript_922/m.2806 type:complete len:328 (-) Transcript_922:1210-2193(-)
MQAIEGAWTLPTVPARVCYGADSLHRQHSSLSIRRQNRHNTRAVRIRHIFCAALGKERSQDLSEAPPIGSLDNADPVDSSAVDITSGTGGSRSDTNCPTGLSPQSIALLGSAAFCIIAADIFAPGPHLLAPLDLFIAQWVESTDLQQKQLAKLLSNGPITIATVGVVVTTLAAGIQRPLLTIQRISTALAVWTFPGWTLTNKDVPVIDVLKHVFRRNRPAFGLEHSSTFSFPSGHTFVCVFFLGVALLMAREASREASFPNAPAESVLTWVRRSSVPIFSLALVTAFGRVLSDVHWCSDTMGGASVATALIGVSFLIQDSLENKSGT